MGKKHKRETVDSIEDLCDCSEWRQGREAIDGFFPGFSAAGQGWSHAMHYYALLFRYCPFCGSRLKKLKKRKHK